jgi:hypothetical protein
MHFNLPPPPIFNLTKPPEPILDIEKILEITQQLLDIRSNKCLQRTEKLSTSFQNNFYQDYHLLSLYAIIFFIILFIILIILFIRKIQKLIPQPQIQVSNEQQHTYIECEAQNNQRKSIETQQTMLSSVNNSYNTVKMDEFPCYLTYDAYTTATESTISEISFNVDRIWQMDRSTLAYQKPEGSYF